MENLRRVGAEGPTNAKIMIVGEAPGAREDQVGRPFMGASGDELTKMLHELGVVRSEVFITNVVKYRPPNNDLDLWIIDSKKKAAEQECRHFADGLYFNDIVARGRQELFAEIESVKPELILAFGNMALWALTGKLGITKWRGSQLYYKNIKLLPTYHPAAVLRAWELRNIAMMDMRRGLAFMGQAKWNKPDYSFLVRPTFSEAVGVLSDLNQRVRHEPTKLSVDIETRRHKFISCIGISWSPTHAACIPIMDVTKPSGYWARDEEIHLTKEIRKLLTHPNALCVGQNFLYDAQYFAKHYGYVPNLHNDTMVMQHIAWAGLPKGLDFLSSMYCAYHEYWKDEGKDWDPRIHDEVQHWTYNCKDAVVTFEVEDSLENTLQKLRLYDVYRDRMTLWPILLRMMLRGVRMNKELRKALSTSLEDEKLSREEWLEKVLRFALNVRSPKQVQDLFYRQLALPQQFNITAKGRRPTCDDEALVKLQQKEPLIIPVVRRIQEVRSLGVFKSTFVDATLDVDERMRCTFNLAGPETYRLSSSENAFGSGTNLQNIPAGNEDEDDIDANVLVLPNVRKLFVPDEGMEIFDIDLAGADAQVVAWEANDEKLKSAFRAGVKIHTVNAKDLFGTNAGPDGKRMPYYKYAKIGVHATNYGCKSRTLSGHLGISVHEADKFQKRWFDIHPEIKQWHTEIERQLQTRRYVENKFGYRRFYFGRVEELLPEALAWIPQSTVAIVTFKAMAQVEKDEFLKAYIQLLLQVHDSLVGQYLQSLRAQILPRLAQATRIVIPYDDPLIIPWGIKTSTVSWGDCEETPEVKNLWKIQN